MEIIFVFKSCMNYIMSSSVENLKGVLPRVMYNRIPHHVYISILVTDWLMYVFEVVFSGDK